MQLGLVVGLNVGDVGIGVFGDLVGVLVGDSVDVEESNVYGTGELVGPFVELFAIIEGELVGDGVGNLVGDGFCAWIWLMCIMYIRMKLINADMLRDLFILK